MTGMVPSFGIACHMTCGTRNCQGKDLARIGLLRNAYRYLLV